MTRTFLCLAALLVASPAGARDIWTVSVYAWDFSSARGGYTTLNGVVGLGRTGEGGPTWTIPITEESRLNGTVFEVTQETAASWGYDWTAARDYIYNNASRYQPGRGDGVFSVGKSFDGVEIVRTRIASHENPYLELQRIIFKQTIGGATIAVFYIEAPEPASAVLLLVGLLFVPRHRYQTPQAPRR